MADKIQQGLFRFNKQFREEFPIHEYSKIVENERMKSTLAGHQKFSFESEVKEFTEPNQGFNLRVREPKKKHVDLQQLDHLAKLEGEAQAISSGGHDQDPNHLLTKDTTLIKEVKEAEKVEEAPANNINFSSPSGNFQGGENRVQALEKHNLDPKDAKQIEDKTLHFRMVPLTRQHTQFTL
jgi:hypothetical protein